jgi:uncharacterized membrane protein YciS (DUF1049 family)
MFITAIYLYGMSQGSWEFSYLYATICFAADLVLVRMLSPDVHINVKNEVSDEEKYCWNKRSQVEELRRVELDRQLYGKR